MATDATNREMNDLQNTPQKRNPPNWSDEEAKRLILTARIRELRRRYPEDEPLAAARGIFNSLILGVLLWAIILGIVWLILR